MKKRLIVAVASTFAALTLIGSGSQALAMGHEWEVTGSGSSPAHTTTLAAGHEWEFTSSGHEWEIAPAKGHEWEIVSSGHEWE
ncbi:MAG: hypothetical protein ACRDP4_07415 [Nocardioidaceae bacterium]